VCVGVCVCEVPDISLSLQVSSSDSDVTLCPTDSSHQQLCRASGCSASFTQIGELATHYTERHRFVVGPPSSKSDLKIYNQCMSAQRSTVSGKRKRAADQRGRASKRIRTKTRYRHGHNSGFFIRLFGAFYTKSSVLFWFLKQGFELKIYM